MRISDWSSDVCSSDLRGRAIAAIGFPVRIVSHPHLAQIEQPHHCRDHRLLFRPAVSQIALHLPPQSGQRSAELKAAVVFPRFLGLAIGGVVAVLLASPRIISDGLQMPVRIRAEPAVHIGGRKADAVQPPDFFRVLDSPASRVEIGPADPMRSEEHTSELQSLMRISYAVFCLKKKKSIQPK